MKIIIEVDSTEDNAKIESFVKKFVEENFQKYQEANIKIEN